MKNVIIKKNFQFGLLIIFNLISASLIFLTIKNDEYQIWWICWPILLLTIITWITLKEMLIDDKKIIWRHYFSKKQIWEIDKLKIKKIFLRTAMKSSGFSKVIFRLDNGIEYKIKSLPGGDIDDFIKLFDNNKIEFYKEIEFRWVKYEPKKWVKYK